MNLGFWGKGGKDGWTNRAGGQQKAEKLPRENEWLPTHFKCRHWRIEWHSELYREPLKTLPRFCGETIVFVYLRQAGKRNCFTSYSQNLGRVLEVPCISSRWFKMVYFCGIWVVFISSDLHFTLQLGSCHKCFWGDHFKSESKISLYSTLGIWT